MLEITIPAREAGWDPVKEEFVYDGKDQTIMLEHSLVSISKWESKWCKAFLATKGKTAEEITDYVRCMTISKNVDPEVYNRLTMQNMKAINDYINAPMSATKFLEGGPGGKKNSDTVTSELIYYWMIAYNIPYEFERWHLNRLLTLVQICNAKNSDPKKMSQSEIMRRNAELNAKRRAQLGTKG